MADTKQWPTTPAKGGPTGKRRRGRPRTRVPNPLYAQPNHRFYAVLVYRLLLAAMISAVFIVGMLTNKG